MLRTFPRIADTIARTIIIGAVLLTVGLTVIFYVIGGSPYITHAGIAHDQPVPFSHEHHVGGLGIDCRYCHFTVEKASFAGIPPTQVCMNCHSQLWTDSPMLEPLRQSFRSGR